MIDVKELRVGNWVTWIGPEHIQIKSGFQIDEHVLDPIPLTPEILKKCGFEERENNPVFATRSKRYIKSMIVVYLEASPKVYVGLFDNPCVTLHQLQNLYFALTGAELNYQP